MTTELTLSQNAGLAALDARFEDQKALDILRNQLTRDIAPRDFQLFIEVARHTGLDPWRNQIYAIKRGGRMTIQTGIDGYRLIAHRTGALAGIDDADFEEQEDGLRPTKATVTVWRMVQGTRVPFTASARWKEYAPQPLTGVWPKMPFQMLAKCAESLALRKAFPAEMSGVYSQEEMDQADLPVTNWDAPEYVSPNPDNIPNAATATERRETLATGGAKAETAAQKREQAKASSRSQSLADAARAEGLTPSEPQNPMAAIPTTDTAAIMARTPGWAHADIQTLLAAGRKLGELAGLLHPPIGKPEGSKVVPSDFAAWANALPSNLDPRESFHVELINFQFLPDDTVIETYEVVALDGSGETVSVPVGEPVPNGYRILPELGEPLPESDEEAGFE